jgi:hypothetical protein
MPVPLLSQIVDCLRGTAILGCVLKGIQAFFSILLEVTVANDSDERRYDCFCLAVARGRECCLT